MKTSDRPGRLGEQAIWIKSIRAQGIPDRHRTPNDVGRRLADRRFKPANVLSEGLAASNAKLYSSFRSKLILPGG
jgi:hypothetical protein